MAGYPALLRLKHDGEEEKDTLGVHLFVADLPEMKEALKRGPDLGVGLRYKFYVGRRDTIELEDFFMFGYSYGYEDVFGKPWAEVVREGSPHFPGGKLEVKVTVKLAV